MEEGKEEGGEREREGKLRKETKKKRQKEYFRCTEICRNIDTS
jgi:hypothetical protein